MVDRLWAPWRKKYVLGRKKKGCFICSIKRSKQDRSNLVLCRTKHSFAVLNLYPYNNGHVMVVPNRHAKTIARLSDEEKLDLQHLVDTVIMRLEKKMTPQGFNLGMNLGVAAGAGLSSHVHVHVVPRWRGDTNFMTVTADTRIISQSLSSTYEKLVFRTTGGGKL